MDIRESIAEIREGLRMLRIAFTDKDRYKEFSYGLLYDSLRWTPQEKVTGPMIAGLVNTMQSISQHGMTFQEVRLEIEGLGFLTLPPDRICN